MSHLQKSIIPQFLFEFLRQKCRYMTILRDFSTLCTIRLFLLFLNTIKISGRIHSDVYARWKNGDQLVKEGMKSFADFTTEAVEALQSQNWTQLGKLMDMNFDKRREIYGEAALGSKNLQMIEIARKHSAHCKFPGNLQLFF